MIPTVSATLALLQDPERQRATGILVDDEAIPAWPEFHELYFENVGDRPVDVFWMSTRLSEAHQCLVEPGSSEGVNTLLGHRFRFRDHVTGYVVQDDHITDPDISIVELR